MNIDCNISPLHSWIFYLRFELLVLRLLDPDSVIYTFVYIERDTLCRLWYLNWRLSGYMV